MELKNLEIGNFVTYRFYNKWNYGVVIDKNKDIICISDTRIDIDINNPNIKIEEVYPNWAKQFDEKYRIYPKPDILTDEEKEYLSAVIKPFRHKIEGIEVCCWCPNCNYIVIRMNDKQTPITLPFFEADTMYKGMEYNKLYTLEELGL